MRSVPNFPIPIWNVYDRVMKNLARSNNSLESWHKSFSQDINSHPNINKLIRHFIREQHLTEVNFQQIRSGVIFERLKVEVNRDNAIKDLFKDYNKKNIDSILERLIFILNK